MIARHGQQVNHPVRLNARSFKANGPIAAECRKNLPAELRAGHITCDSGRHIAGLSPPSQRLAIVRLADGREFAATDVRIKVAERPEDLAILAEQEWLDSSSSRDESAKFGSVGISAQNLTSSLAEQLGVRAGGVVITSVDRNSPASDVG